MPDSDLHYVLAIDPGRYKCGFAFVAWTPGSPKPPDCLQRGIVPPDQVGPIWEDCAAAHPSFTLILGNGTGSRDLAAVLKGLGADCRFVQERFTTRLARERYFRDNPPRGWRRILPLSLLTPPCPVDDLAALLIAEDWVQTRNESG